MPNTSQFFFYKRNHLFSVHPLKLMVPVITDIQGPCTSNGIHITSGNGMFLRRYPVRSLLSHERISDDRSDFSYQGSSKIGIHCVYAWTEFEFQMTGIVGSSEFLFLSCLKFYLDCIFVRMIEHGTFNTISWIIRGIFHLHEKCVSREVVFVRTYQVELMKILRGWKFHNIDGERKSFPWTRQNGNEVKWKQSM